MKQPTPEQILAKRTAAHLTQTQAALLIHSTKRSWQDWEAGINRMHPAWWELFNIKVKGLK